jgi:hypothetical protein
MQALVPAQNATNTNTKDEYFTGFVRNKQISFKKAVATEPFHRLFHLPLSVEAFGHMESLQQLL